MAIEGSDKWLRIDQALRQFCDPELVAAVRSAEGNYSEITLRVFGHPNLGGARAPRPGDNLTGSSTSQRHHAEYMFAWNAMMADFRNKLVQEDLFLLGVSVLPTRDTTFSLIPGVWAADYEIDFETEVVSVGANRYLAVRCTPVRPMLAVNSPSNAPAESPRRTAAGIGELTDEEILELLEEHARRVIAGPDSKLIAPGKISMMPLIAGKLRHRAERGELLATQAAEMLWLYNWVKSKVDLHYVPKPGAIKRVLGKQYEALKVRSNGAIQ